MIAPDPDHLSMLGLDRHLAHAAMMLGYAYCSSSAMIGDPPPGVDVSNITTEQMADAARTQVILAGLLALKESVDGLAAAMAGRPQ